MELFKLDPMLGMSCLDPLSNRPGEATNIETIEVDA